MKVGVKLNGLIIKTSCKVDENVSATIEELCLDIHALLSQYEPYDTMTLLVLMCIKNILLKR